MMNKINKLPKCKVCDREVTRCIEVEGMKYCTDCFEKVYKKPKIIKCDICNAEISSYTEVDGKRYCSLQCLEKGSIDVDALVEETLYELATKNIEAAEFVLFNIMNNPSYFRQDERLKRNGVLKSILRCYSEKRN